MTDTEWQKKASGRISRIRKSKKPEKWDETKLEDWENRPLTGGSAFVNGLVFLTVVSLLAALAVFVALSGK